MSKASKPAGAVSTTVTAAARAQSAVARVNGGQVPRGSYVGRLQATAAKRSTQRGNEAMKRCETQDATKHDLDNRSRQLNPKDKAYWQSRGAEMADSPPAPAVHDRPAAEGIKRD